MYSRSAKNLTLSREAQTLLELPAQATPNEVIKAILKSHVDLLWNGGIGTYVKASSESHSDVGDRSNDAVRIDATELNCKVVGEGGNLGLLAARAHRVCAPRRPAQHRLHRQFRRRQLFGRRGELEDPAERRRSLGGNHARGARSAAGADDRRSGGAGVAQQLPAESGDQHQRIPRQGALERERIRHPRARALRRSESRPGVPAVG